MASGNKAKCIRVKFCWFSGHETSTTKATAVKNPRIPKEKWQSGKEMKKFAFCQSLSFSPLVDVFEPLSFFRRTVIFNSSGRRTDKGLGFIFSSTHWRIFFCDSVIKSKKSSKTHRIYKKVAWFFKLTGAKQIFIKSTSVLMRLKQHLERFISIGHCLHYEYWLVKFK